MSYQFAGSLYPSHRAMVDAIVRNWMQAGGLNGDDTVRDFFRKETDESLVDECIETWFPPERSCSWCGSDCTDEDHEGEPDAGRHKPMTAMERMGVDRDDLLEAMARLREEYRPNECPCHTVWGEGADKCKKQMRPSEAVRVTCIDAYNVETARKLGSARGMSYSIKVHPDCADSLDRETDPDGRLDDAFIVD